MRNHIATIRLFLAFTQGSEELNLRANVPELCVRGPSVQQINDKLFVTPGSKLAEMELAASRSPEKYCKVPSAEATILQIMRRFLVITLAVVGLVPVFGRAQAVITNTVLGVRTEFITDALLTDEEVKAVVALAKDCGFEEVAVVRTFHFLPTLQRGIEATSKDQIAGRTVTYQTVVIYREGWSEQLKPTGPLRTISNGSFWVEDLILKNHELTLFNTSKGVVRVELGHDVSLVEADKVIDALTCGRIHFADDFVKDRYRGIDFAHPSRLKKSDQTGEFSVSFSDGMAEFGLELSGKDVTLFGGSFATP